VHVGCASLHRLPRGLGAGGGGPNLPPSSFSFHSSSLSDFLCDGGWIGENSPRAATGREKAGRWLLMGG
jgi:hypothetical protein